MSLYHIFKLTSYIFQSHRLLLYDTLKLVVLTSPSAVCMILLPHELVLLHASEPFLASKEIIAGKMQTSSAETENASNDVTICFSTMNAIYSI